MAWKEFKKGKKEKKDVQEFEKNIMANILNLHYELKNKYYKHSDYVSFYINDPKLRKIHKACVKDRVLHHAIFRILYPIFDRLFIADSYSCRNGKGTHRAARRLDCFLRMASKNNSKNCYVLKCDIKKFFDSIAQKILIGLIEKEIKDENTLLLIDKIIKSFSKGLPLGNITSQLFANIYLNELDKFIKHKLKIKYYIRYCDDFVILSNNYEKLIFRISDFLKNDLQLTLHPDKIIIKKSRQGIDFLGYVIFPGHKILRVKTKKRMMRAIKKARMEYNRGEIREENFNQKMQAYLGVLKHCSGYKIKKKMQ